MSRGPRIKDWIKFYVHGEALNNRAEPRDSVAQRIEDYLRDKESVPSRDTLIKMISSARNSGDPEDRPWTVSTLVDYDIPPETLPTVMAVWAKALELDITMSIRQVKWIARLYHVLKDKDIDFLREFAFMYARSEAVTRPMEKYPEKPEDAWLLWLNDAKLYRVMSGDDGPYRKCAEHVPVGWRLLDTKELVIRRSDPKQKEALDERSYNKKG